MLPCPTFISAFLLMAALQQTFVLPSASKFHVQFFSVRISVRDRRMNFVYALRQNADNRFLLYACHGLVSQCVLGPLTTAQLVLLMLGTG